MAFACGCRRISGERVDNWGSQLLVSPEGCHSSCKRIDLLRGQSVYRLSRACQGRRSGCRCGSQALDGDYRLARARQFSTYPQPWPLSRPPISSQSAPPCRGRGGPCIWPVCSLCWRPESAPVFRRPADPGSMAFALNLGAALPPVAAWTFENILPLPRAPLLPQTNLLRLFHGPCSTLQSQCQYGCQ